MSREVKKPKTHVALVLDQSGSMWNRRQQAVENYNEQVQQMKMNAKEQDLTCSLITFNGHVYEHFWNQDVHELSEATEEDYLTGGSTAFRDAIGYTVEKLLRTTECDDNTAYLVIVVSDGIDNNSTHFDPLALKELLDRVQATRKWTFSYMGCDRGNVEKVAAETGIPLSNMATWNIHDPLIGSKCFHAANEQLQSYYNNRCMGNTASFNLMSTEAGVCRDFAAEFSVDNQPITADQPTYTSVEPTVKFSDVQQVQNKARVNPFSNSHTPVEW